MSSSFPPVPGFVGPLSLKAFLDDYFGLRLTFGHVGANPSTTAPRPLRDVVLPPNAAFLVVVYVARHAPSPPTPSGIGNAAQRDGESRDNAFAPARQKNENCHANKAATPLAAPSPSFYRSRSLSATTGISAAAAAPWLHYTKATNRPFTEAVLQHPWWTSVAACLGTAGVAFLETYCPVVVQLEAMAGGVQVLGPALQYTVSPFARAASGAAPSPSPLRKRARDRSIGAAVTSTEEKRRQSISLSRKTRTEAGKGGPSSLSVKLSPSTDASWFAALPRTDVSRTRLYSVRAEDSGVMGHASPTASDTNIDPHVARPVPPCLLEALWLSCHPRSLDCVLRAALPRWEASHMTKASPPALNVEGSDPFSLPLCHVKHVFRWMTFAETFAANKTDTTAVQELSVFPKPPVFDVETHLQRILSSVLEQCRRLDLRGAALKHLGFLEDRYRRQQQGKEAPDIRRLAAPVAVVVEYLRTVLGALKWTSPSFSSSAIGKACSQTSFWSVPGRNSGNFTRRVLDALLEATQAWLSSGRRAVFPLSRFLEGVAVSQVPWLAGFYTKPLSKSSASHRHARRSRSQVQQRVWLQFVLFLTQDVLPFVLRAAFTVTWSSRNPNELLFFPASVWRQVVRCELRRSTGRSSFSSSSTSDSDAQSRLRRISTMDALQEREDAATLVTPLDKPALLYAAVRFRPDKHKLRPIAVLRSASTRSVKQMVRGAPSPYSHAGALVRFLSSILKAESVTLPESTVAALVWVYNKLPMRKAAIPSHCPKGTVVSRVHRIALRDALRCLMSGVEERRVRDGLPRLSDMSHQDEYAELRSFCEEVRRTAHPSQCPRGGAAPMAVSLVRSDATRCYDNLPQERVLREVEALVCHDAYRTLTFTSIFAADTGPAGDGGLESLKSSAATVSDAQLRRLTLTRTVPCECISKNELPRIPRGHVYWEEEEGEEMDGKRRAKGAGYLTKHGGVAHARSRGAPPFNIIDGRKVRALLREHLQRHLIVHDGAVMEQRVGILQGSPVAMLLCDQLFSAVVDVALSHILGQHAERSLLLRRVDDVLVATTSHVAAQRCRQAMEDGWEGVGYRSNKQKLTLSFSQNVNVAWCGLLLHDRTLEVSVEWQRMESVLRSLCVSDTRRVYRGDREPLLFTQRLLSVVQLRVPPTALCGRLNSRGRQLQTIYEAALLWSRLAVTKVQETLSVARHPCVPVLLLRPLAACVARLCRLLRRHEAFLQARQSWCGVGTAEVRACVLVALHRTLQARLQVLLMTQTRCIRAAQRKHYRRPDAEQFRPEGRPEGQRGRRLSSGSSEHRQTVDLWAFWRGAARQVAAQSRESLRSLERSEHAAPVVQNTSAGSSATPPPVPVLAAQLLREDGPSSLHERALCAIQLARHH